MTKKIKLTPRPWWETKTTATMVDFERLKTDATALLVALNILIEETKDQAVIPSIIEGIRRTITKTQRRA